MKISKSLDKFLTIIGNILSLAPCAVIGAYAANAVNGQLQQ